MNRKAVVPVMGSKDGYWILCQIAKRVLRQDEYNRYFLQLEKEGVRPTWKSQFAGFTKQAPAYMTPEEVNSIPRTLDDLLDHGSWGTRRLVLDQKPKT